MKVENELGNTANIHGAHYWHVIYWKTCQGESNVINNLYEHFHFLVIQLFSHVWVFAIPWTAGCQVFLSFTISRAWSNSCPSSWWCHPPISSSIIPLSSCLQSFPVAGSFLMESQLFASGSQSIGFSFSINPSNEYSGLISFIIDWFDLLAVQRTLKSILQHHSSKALILQCSAFFIIRLSHHTWLLEKHSLD